MIGLYEQEGNLDFLQYTQGMSHSIISYIEKYTQKKEYPLSKIQNHYQTRKIVDNVLKFNLENILHISPTLITDIDLKKFKSYLLEETTNISGMNTLNWFLKDNPTIIDGKLINGLFKKDKNTFLNICSNFEINYLSDGMVMKIIKAKIESFNSYHQKQLKTRITKEMIDLLIKKYSINVIFDNADLFPIELLEKYPRDNELEKNKKRIKEEGADLLIIPKQQQTKELLDYAMNESEFPINEEFLVSYILQINPKILPLSIVKKSIYFSNAKKTEILKNEYLTQAHIKDYATNVAMASNPLFWDILNVDLIDDKIIFTMLGKIEEENKDTLLPIIEKLQQQTINTKKLSK